MRLHLGRLGDFSQSIITIEYVDIVGPLTTQQLKEKKKHNQAMLEIASALSYLEFEDIKGCKLAKIMWDSIQNIYGGDKNV